jgi:hypothetical protein
MKKVKRTKPYREMTTAELRDTTREFDADFVSTSPLTGRMKARLRRANRGRGRPRVGRGATAVLISIERDLLREADQFAKEHRLSRSQLIARGLRTVMKAVS